MKRAVALIAALLLGPAATALGHGGYPVIEEVQGGYSVRVFASNAPRGGIDLTVYLIRQDLGEPDATADVSLTVTTADGEQRSGTAKFVADGYEALFPGERGEWRDWEIKAAVSGPAGNVELTGAPIGRDEAGLPGGTLAVLVAVVAITAIGSLLVIRRRLAKLGEQQ